MLRRNTDQVDSWANDRWEFGTVGSGQVDRPLWILATCGRMVKISRGYRLEASTSVTKYKVFWPISLTIRMFSFCGLELISLGLRYSCLDGEETYKFPPPSIYRFAYTPLIVSNARDESNKNSSILGVSSIWPACVAELSLETCEQAWKMYIICREWS